MRELTKEEQELVEAKKESLTERGIDIVSIRKNRSSQDSKTIITAHPQIIRFDFEVPSELFAQ